MNGVKPRLLIFINTLQRGGAERVVSILLNHLKDEFDLHLALYTNIIEYNFPAEIKVLNLNQPLKENKILRFLKLPFVSYRIYRYCVNNKIKTSVGFLYRPCYINALLKSLWGFKGKIIMCERTHQSTMIFTHRHLYKLFTKFMVKYSYQKADLVLANSYAIQIDLIEKFKITTPIRVIYNPIDLNQTKIDENANLLFEFEDGVFHFVNVGGFRKEKNHLLLLQAFFILKHLPCKLIIVGGGDREDDLKQKVIDLGIEDKAIFCGFRSNPFKFVKRSDCFVLSSDVEGFPNALIEALACGKPVISTDCNSGPRELLAPATDIHHRAIINYEIGEYGILTPVNDVASLAAAMKKMYEDTALRKKFEDKAKPRAQQFNVDEIKQYFQAAFTAI